jgi:hypothetical protein
MGEDSMTLDEVKALKVGDLLRYATSDKTTETIEVVVETWDRGCDMFAVQVVTVAVLLDKLSNCFVGEEGVITRTNCGIFERIA